MRKRSPKARLLTTLAAVMSSALAVPAAAVVAPASAAVRTNASAAVRTAPASSTTRSATRVLLPTGEHVRLSRDARGRPSVQILSNGRHGAGASFQQVVTGSHVYLIPLPARPYLGRVLDPALFDVAGLAGGSAQGRVSVRLTFTGTTVPAVPGVTVTTHGAGTADGYLTATSAKAFGTALAARYAADARAGFPHTSTLFGVSRLSATSSNGPVVHPQYAMHTVQLKLVDFAGKPVPDGYVDYLNLDNGLKANGWGIVEDGEARISVPVGTYALDTLVVANDADGNPTKVAVLAKTVKITGEGQSVVLDARTARSRPSIRTPRPAQIRGESFDLEWVDAPQTVGYGSTVALDDSMALPDLVVSPAPAPSAGSLTSTAGWVLWGTPSRGPSYEYTLSYPSVGIPTHQSHVLASKDVATTLNRYVREPGATTATLLRSPFLPTSNGSFAMGFPFDLPATRLDYANVVPQQVWSDNVVEFNETAEDPWDTGVFLDDVARSQTAGQVRHAAWGEPVAFSRASIIWPDTPAWAADRTCYNCRTSGQLSLAVDLAKDDYGHFYEVFSSDDPTKQAVRSRLLVNGTKVVDQTDTSWVTADVPTSAASYQYLVDVDRTASAATRAVKIHTDLRFRSVAGSGPKAPSSWGCPLEPATGCRILPLLQAHVNLPVDSAGGLQAGRTAVTVRVGHIQGAESVPLTAVHLQVRRANGTWVQVPLHAVGQGVFQGALVLRSTDAGSVWDLRVIATDKAGTQLTQTATAAFAVAAG